MNELITFSLFVSFTYFLIWIREKISPSPDYIVTKVNDKTGTEIRFDGRSVWVHVNDENKFKKHLKKLQKIVQKDLK